VWSGAPEESASIPHWMETVIAGRLFSPGTPVSSTNETVRHDIHCVLTEILLKVALNTITLTLSLCLYCCLCTRFVPLLDCHFGLAEDNNIFMSNWWETIDVRWWRSYFTKFLLCLTGILPFLSLTGKRKTMSNY
jgi:hypothetical protein